MAANSCTTRPPSCAKINAIGVSVYVCVCVCVCVDGWMDGLHHSYPFPAVSPPVAVCLSVSLSVCLSVSVSP